jgi:hypothetical protein
MKQKTKPPELGLMIHLTPPRCYSANPGDWTTNTYATCKASIICRSEPNDDGTPQRCRYDSPGRYTTSVPYWPGFGFSAQHDIGRMLESADLWTASARWYGHRIAYDATYSSEPLDTRHLTAMLATARLIDRRAERLEEKTPTPRICTLGEHLHRFAALIGARFCLVIRAGIDSYDTRHEDTPASAARVIDGWTENIAQEARKTNRPAA